MLRLSSRRRTRLGLGNLSSVASTDSDAKVRVVDQTAEHYGDYYDEDGRLNLSIFVDGMPLTLSVNDPVEYSAEMLGKLGSSTHSLLRNEIGRS